MDDWNLVELKYLVCDNIYNIVNLQCANYFFKEWQIMLGLHLVLVTPHGWFTIGIDQHK